MVFVSGIVTFNNPINTNILVQAFDKDMRSGQLLGEVTVPRPPSSTAPVLYTITYNTDRFLRDDKHTADLFVVATTLDEKSSAQL